MMIKQSEAEKRPLFVHQGEKGVETAVYGDCLPATEEERREREKELAELCARLCFNSVPTAEAQ